LGLDKIDFDNLCLDNYQQDSRNSTELCSEAACWIHRDIRHSRIFCMRRHSWEFGDIEIEKLEWLINFQTSFSWFWARKKTVLEKYRIVLFRAGQQKVVLSFPQRYKFHKIFHSVPTLRARVGKNRQKIFAFCSLPNIVKARMWKSLPSASQERYRSRNATKKNFLYRIS